MTGAACLALLPLTASAQDDFDPAKMEEIMKKYGTPGKEHKVLRSWVGTWKTESTYWMMPGAPPMKSSGEATFRGTTEKAACHGEAQRRREDTEREQEGFHELSSLEVRL
ncbi:MAG: DUF1579 family protein [Akkermansiaceae bacterium]